MTTTRGEFLDVIRKVRSHNGLLCVSFQRDLSALLDGELPEQSSRRTLAHMEACSSCAEFFQAIRLQTLAHRDLAVPGSLARRLGRMRGEDLFEGMTDAEIVRRLASALYELGKAYVLLANDGDYLLQVAQEPVEVDKFSAGEMADAMHVAGESGACSLSEESLRARGDDYLAHGGRLLEEALDLKPKFAEARIYSGFVHQLCGREDEALGCYREVFLHTDRPANRAHAAIQMGQIYDERGEHRQALRSYRWVLASGMLARNPDLAFVLFNIAIEHLSLGDTNRAVSMLLRIRDDYPETWSHCSDWLQSSPHFLSDLRSNADFRAQIEREEPAFFAA